MAALLRWRPSEFSTNQSQRQNEATRHQPLWATFKSGPHVSRPTLLAET